MQKLKKKLIIQKLEINSYIYLQKLFKISFIINIIGINNEINFEKFLLANLAIHFQFLLLKWQIYLYTNDPIPREYPERQKDRLKDTRMGKPYFTGPFQLSPRVQQLQLQQMCI